MKPDLSAYDAALEHCLKAILEDGLSVERALSVYPELADQLRSELDTALWLRSQRQALSAHKWEIGSSRRRLENRLLTLRPNWPAYFHRLSLLRRTFQVAVLLLLVLSLAQFNMKVAYASAASIPGDPFYPLKLAREQAQLALAFDQDDEARVLLEIALQRSIELQSLVLEGRYDDIGPISDQVGRSFARVQTYIDNASSNQNSSALAQELQDSLEIQRAVLSALAGMVPPQVRAQLEPLLVPGPQN